VLLEVAAVKVLANVGAALHALQHGHLNGNIRTGFRFRREAGRAVYLEFQHSFLALPALSLPQKIKGGNAKQSQRGKKQQKSKPMVGSTLALRVRLL
jgi:hypothetical protein